MQWGSYRFVNGLLLIASIVGMAFALYLEHVKGLEPCPLCVFQRIGLIAMGLVASVSVIHNPVSNIVKRLYAFGDLSHDLVCRCCCATRLVAAFTTRSSAKLWAGTGLSGRCPAIENRFSAGSDRFGRVCHGRLDILGQSLPFWSLVFFCILLMLCLWQLVRNYPYSKAVKKNINLVLPDKISKGQLGIYQAGLSNSDN